MTAKAGTTLAQEFVQEVMNENRKYVQYRVHYLTDFLNRSHKRMVYTHLTLIDTKLHNLNNTLESAELLVIISCFMSRLGIVNRRLERYGSDELLCN